MNKKIMFITSGSGSLLDICLRFKHFRNLINVIICDRECKAIDVAKKNNIEGLLIKNVSSEVWCNDVLEIAVKRGIDYILSYSNLKILKGVILKHYENKIFNSHHSILPAFKGLYSSSDTKNKFKATQIFERTLDFGSRITGNTIHVINDKIDDGCPVIVSTLNIPYHEEIEKTRHRLFIQECQTILQLIDWLSQDRVFVNKTGKIEITHASFEKIGFSPNLEREDVINFSL